MKKVILLLLAGMFVLGLGSCDDHKYDKGNKKQDERHERRW